MKLVHPNGKAVDIDSGMFNRMVGAARANLLRLQKEEGTMFPAIDRDTLKTTYFIDSWVYIQDSLGKQIEEAVKKKNE